MNCSISGNGFAAPITLVTETLSTPTISLTYRLLLLARSEHVFAVEIAEQGGHSETEVVGADLTAAIAVYLKLVKRGVRACHLADILHDIAYDQ